MTEPRKFTRRQVVVGGAAVAALGACGNGGATGSRAGAARDVTTTTAATAATGAPGTTPATVARANREPASPARYVSHGDRSASRVALTFHASGDPALAQRLLDVLAIRNTAVTVFGVGQWLATHPDLVDRIRRDGHELANHTQTHQAMGRLGRMQVRDEIVGCAEVLQSLTGSITAWFRPSGIVVPTPTILAEAGRAGYPVSVGYDLDSLDFQDPGASMVELNVRRGVRPGSIVSLHFGHSGTIDALGGILDHLQSIGLQPVTISGLLT